MGSLLSAPKMSSSRLVLASSHVSLGRIGQPRGSHRFRPLGGMAAVHTRKKERKKTRKKNVVVAVEQVGTRSVDEGGGRPCAAGERDAVVAASQPWSPVPGYVLLLDQRRHAWAGRRRRLEQPCSSGLGRMGRTVRRSWGNGTSARLKITHGRHAIRAWARAIGPLTGGALLVAP